jgi:hypothetical protein
MWQGEMTMTKRFRWLALVGAFVSAMASGGATAQSVETLENDSFTIAFTGDMPGTGYQRSRHQ